MPCQTAGHFYFFKELNVKLVQAFFTPTPLNKLYCTFYFNKLYI